MMRITKEALDAFEEIAEGKKDKNITVIANIYAGNFV